MFDLATLVDTQQLIESVVASIVAALTVTVVICLAIWGAVKYGDFSQNGRGAAAIGAISVSIFGLAATAGIIGYTIYLMISAPK